MSVTETACAKINLALHITARRDDGYHELDSLVAFADIGDQLTITPADQTSLEITGPFAPQLAGVSGNIVLDACQAMHAAWPQHFAPVAIRLTKNLPVASGIGGGSADAAAVLCGLEEIFGDIQDHERVEKIALQLGADVPVCRRRQTCRMTGIGQDLENVTDAPAFAAVLVNPGIAVSTPKVFAALGLKACELAGPPMPALPATRSGQGWLDWLATCRNDLQAPAISLVPEIDVVLDAIAAQPGCLLHRMSGSGATCFGLFEDDHFARRAGEMLDAQNNGWWVRQTTIG